MVWDGKMVSLMENATIALIKIVHIVVAIIKYTNIASILIASIELKVLQHLDCACHAMILQHVRLTDAMCLQ